MSNNSGYQPPFLVDQLRPQGATGLGGKFYQLTPASASPVRHIGRDKLGRPIEDTVPTVAWRPFVMLDGCVNKVPIRTCSEFKMEPESVAYENDITKELISAGCMPLDACPYTFEYSFITKGPLAEIPSGEKDCGGNKDGCKHMRAIMDARKADALARHEIEQKNVQEMDPTKVKQLMEMVSEGVGDAIARHLPQQVKAARSRLQDGRGEE